MEGESPTLSMYMSFQAWFDTCNKMLLSVLRYRCLDLALYIDSFPLILRSSFNVTRPHRVFCTNNAASKSIILSCIIFLYEKLKNYSIQSFKECLFFVFCLFCFLLLSNNTLHVMFYTYICYWNTFQYKYIIQFTFHVVKQSHARVTSR